MKDLYSPPGTFPPSEERAQVGLGIRTASTFEKVKAPGEQMKIQASPRQGYHLSWMLSVTPEDIVGHCGRGTRRREYPKDFSSSPGSGQKHNLPPQNWAYSTPPCSRTSHEEIADHGKGLPSHQGLG